MNTLYSGLMVCRAPPWKDRLQPRKTKQIKTDMDRSYGCEASVPRWNVGQHVDGKPFRGRRLDLRTG